MQTIAINNEKLTFNNIYYVDVNGDDANGTGSRDNPFKTVNYAVTKCATSGDAIYALEGVHDVTRIAGTYDSGGLYDGGKAISFIGEKHKTVFLCDGTKHASRDTHAIMFTNAGSKAYQIIFDQRVGTRSGNYPTSITGAGDHGAVLGEIINCVIKTDSPTPSTTYSNSATSTIKFTNCVFDVKANFVASYSGNGSQKINCACNYNMDNVNLTTCITNATFDDKYNITSAGWENTGTGLNYDGTIANIGVYGGLFEWIFFSTYTLIRDMLTDELFTFDFNIGEWKKIDLESITFENLKSFAIDNITLIPKEKWNELSGKVEFFTWHDSQNEIKAEITTPIHKPIERLENPIKLITYSDDQDDVLIKMDLTVENRIRYLISKDKRNTWHTYDGTWKSVALESIHDNGMSKTQLEAITPEQWKQWFNRNQLDFAIGIWSNNPVEKPVVKSITVNFPANAAPIVKDFTVTPSTVLRDNLHATATIIDLEGDPLQYRILINDKPYTNLSNDGWTTLTSMETTVEMSEIIDYKLLKSGLNAIKLIVRDDRSVTYEAPYISVNLINTAPYQVSIANDNWSFNVQIDDNESDRIKYRILINGVQKFPKTTDYTTPTYTNFMNVPTNISFNWISDDLIYGKEDNTVTLEVLDEIGESFVYEINNIVGKYKNLMFLVDVPYERYYSDDKGELIVWQPENLLSYLDFGTITAGQVTDSEKIYVKNMFGYAVNNVKVSVNMDTVTGYDVQIAKDQSFSPTGTDTMQVLTYNQTLQDDEQVEFYIRISSNPSSGGAGGIFEIVTGADVV